MPDSRSSPASASARGAGRGRRPPGPSRGRDPLDRPRAERLARGILAGEGAIRAAGAAWRRVCGSPPPGRGVAREDWEGLSRDHLAALEPLAAAWPYLARAEGDAAEAVSPEVRGLAREAAWLARALSGDSFRRELNARLHERRAGTLRGSPGIGETLTEEQALAATMPDPASLVLAPAGSGKTRVLAARAAWLVGSGAAPAGETLTVCFGRAACAEMRRRIVGCLGAGAEGMAVSTFHALGRHIIGSATGRALQVHERTVDSRMEGTVQGILLQACRDDPSFLDRVAALLAHRGEPDGEGPAGAAGAPMHAFQAARDWERAVDSLDLESLAGDRLGTSEDRALADALTLLGVPFEVLGSGGGWKGREGSGDSAPRWAGAAMSLRGGAAVWAEPAMPDGSGVPWIDGARLEGVLARRRERSPVHAGIPSWRLADGAGARSEARAALAGMRIPVDATPDGVFRLLGGGDGERGGAAPVARLRRTLASWIRLSKAAAVPEAEARRRMEATRLGTLFLPVAEEVVARYESMLCSGASYGPGGLEGPPRSGDPGRGVDSRATVDFADYLELAAGLVREGRFDSPWTEILVDEAQDMFPGATDLLQALLASRPGTRLHCVGDDWQGIYGWNGADAAALGDFAGRFGPDARSMPLTRTFRCAPDAAAVASRFVLRNPAQTRRPVRGEPARESEGPSVSVRLPWRGTPPVRARADLRAAVVDAVLDLASAGRPPGGGEGPVSVLVMSRYRGTPAALGLPDGISSPGPDGAWEGLDVSWSTVHGAKGAEADHALVLEVAAGPWGFPSPHRDDRVLEALRPEPDPFPHAEERRLLYVALTRARGRTCAMALRGRPSPFLEELAADPRVRLEGWGPEGWEPDGEERFPAWCGECREQPQLVSARGLALRWCPSCGARHAADLEALQDRLGI